MGILSTYAELKDAVAVYAKRSNASFTAAIPIFVNSAHQTLMRDLDVSLPMLLATADLTINAERVSPPSGFRSVVRLHLDRDYDNPLSPTTIELRMREAAVTTAGPPRLFALDGDSIAFGPVPDLTYTGKLLYRRAFDFFASDLATNALLTRYPMAYLYGALAEAYGFDKFDEDQAKYVTLFRSEIDKINMAERTFAMGGGAVTMSPSGPAV
ncbi:MAG: hypothetical protein A3E78_09485 [Alphaproteobacteria bacterium RIFCSPHIGHO2_12_FULL_63_12]|nr:MAG: hypothetical protein A3E78_09485 [Alphaproteobacteria bacterium RIFCSPHIGHO2_12_FULL_63_12]